MEAAYKPTVVGDLDTQNFEKFPDVSSLEINELQYRILVEISFIKMKICLILSHVLLSSSSALNQSLL